MPEDLVTIYIVQRGFVFVYFKSSLLYRYHLQVALRYPTGLGKGLGVVRDSSGDEAEVLVIEIDGRDRCDGYDLCGEVLGWHVGTAIGRPEALEPIVERSDGRGL